MEIEIVAKYSRYKRYLADLSQVAATLLHLERYDFGLVVTVDREFPQHDGLTIPLEVCRSYLVVLQPDKPFQLGVTLCHELIHVQQLVTGRLRMVDGHELWCGKRVSSKTAYLDKPWERLAFSGQELLFRRSLELL